MGLKTGIINVMRKPQKCPVCGGRVVDIIYGTGDMTGYEYVLEYRREGIMGGDNIPRRPPIWACACGCKRFRKVNADGTDAEVKVKLLKNIRPKPLRRINFTAKSVSEAIKNNRMEDIRHYMIEVKTELGEKDVLSISATSEKEAKKLAEEIVESGGIGLRGLYCEEVNVRVIM